MNPELSVFISSKNPVFENGSGQLLLKEVLGDSWIIQVVTGVEDADLVLLDRPTPEAVLALKTLRSEGELKAIWVVVDGGIPIEALQKAGATTIIKGR